MANYEYTGCVTGFSEAGNIQLIQPTETPMPVTRAANAYTERLVGVGLLLPATTTVSYINTGLAANPNGLTIPV